jgi:hypothetical protein
MNRIFRRKVKNINSVYYIFIESIIIYLKALNEGTIDDKIGQANLTSMFRLIGTLVVQSYSKEIHRTHNHSKKQDSHDPNKPKNAD